MTDRPDGTPAPGRPAPLAGVPDALWTPVAAGLLTLLCGVLGLASHQILLFPSIGPTAFLLASSPYAESSRAWNVIVGHVIGLAAGYLALAVLRGNDAPALFAVHALAPVRVWASALAVALSVGAQRAVRASHAPATATTLLVALGGFRATLHDAGAVVVGVLIVAAGGIVLRLARAPGNANPGH